LPKKLVLETEQILLCNLLSFKVAEVIPYEDAVKEMKAAIVKSYGKKGENIVNMNFAAVMIGGEVVKVEIPSDWKDFCCKGNKRR